MLYLPEIPHDVEKYVPLPSGVAILRENSNSAAVGGDYPKADSSRRAPGTYRYNLNNPIVTISQEVDQSSSTDCESHHLQTWPQPWKRKHVRPALQQSGGAERRCRTA